MVDVSVIIPNFNSGEGLSRCLGALCNQTIPRRLYEIIVVDDGSLDDSISAGERFDARVVHQNHAGPAVARNNGVRHSAGKLLLFTDSDCVPQEDWIEQMVRPFEDPNVMAVKGVYRTKQRSLVPRFIQAEFEEKYDRMKRVDRIDYVDTYSAGYRASVFQDNGGFDPSFRGSSEDVEFAFRLARKGYKMAFASSAVVYHTHPASMRRYLVRKFGFGVTRARVYTRFPDRLVRDSYTPKTVHMQILLSGLLCLSLLLGFFQPVALIAALVCAVAFTLSAAVFSFGAFGRDRLIGIVSPPLLFLRCLAQCLGLATGLLGLLVRGEERKILLRRLMKRPTETDR